MLLVLAIVLASTLPGRAETVRRIRTRAFPEIDAVLARKPNARIAVIQGSYDWVHNGHLELMKTIARDKHEGGYDLIVVLPTRLYDRKPFLRASFSRRVRLLNEAVQGDPELAGRVVISRAAAALPDRNRPDHLVRDIASRYPALRFSYVLGSDSYNDSAGWDWHRAVEKNPQVELVVVNRASYAITDASRAARILDGPTTLASSTEIRRALMSGELWRLDLMVPETTMRELKRELRRRERERPPGGKLLEGPTYSERAFAEIAKDVPEGALNLLRGVPEPRLSEDARVRLGTTQERLNTARRDLAAVTLHISSQLANPEKAEQENYIFLAREGGRINGWYLFRPTTEQEAKKLESLTTVANLLGVATPPAIPHHYKSARSPISHRGILMPWAPGLVAASGYDFTKASDRVREGVVLSRWFSQVIGNTRVRPKDFLRPITGPDRWDELLYVAQGDAFGPPVPGGTGERYRFEAPVGWSPASYDSAASMYGRLWRDYVLGRVNLDLVAVKRRLAVVKDLPREALVAALGPYLDAATHEHWGRIALSGADRFFTRRAVERNLVARIYRSVDQYSTFLDLMAAARNRPGHDIYAFYAEMDQAAAR